MVILENIIDEQGDIDLKLILENQVDFANTIIGPNAIDSDVNNWNNIFNEKAKLRPGLEKVDGTDGNRYFIGNMDLMVQGEMYTLPFVASSEDWGYLHLARLDDCRLSSREIVATFSLENSWDTHENLKKVGILYYGGDEMKAPLTVQLKLWGTEFGNGGFYGKQVEPHNKNYVSKLGPEIHGKRYNTDEVLEMSIVEFLRIHKPHSRTEDGGGKLHRYFSGVSELVMNKKKLNRFWEVKVRDVVGIPIEEVIGRRNNAGKGSASFANKYLQTHYGIELGKPVS